MKMSIFTKRFCSFLMAIAMLLCMCTMAVAAETDEDVTESTSVDSFGATPLFNYDESGSVGPIPIGTAAPIHFTMKPYTGFSRILHIGVTPAANTSFHGRLYGTVSHNGKHLCSFELTDEHPSFQKKFTLPASGEYTATVRNESDSSAVFVLAWWE